MALDLGTLTGYLELDDKKFDSILDKLPGKLKGSGVVAGLAAGVVAAGIGTALVTGIEQAVELDSAQRKITAQLGLTEEESARIGGVAGSLFTQAYGESIEEVNTAVGNVVSSIDGMRGATATAVEEMTAKALNFASTFEIDTARSTQVVGQLIKTGLVKDADEGFDLLTTAMQKVPAGVREDILDAADEYGPFFASIGISGDEAFSLLAASSEKGMYGIDKTGDALKEFTIRATDMSTASKVGYDLLGLSQEDLSAKLLAGGDTAAAAFDQIIGGLQGMTDPVAQSQAALALFGTPLEDLSVQEIPAFLESLSGVEGGMGDVEGAADRMGETLGGSAASQWTAIQRTWDSVIGQLGQGLLPIMQEVMGFISENPVVLQAVAIALGVLAVAFAGVTVATWAMNTALLANPITWIVLAIVALIGALVLLVMNWDTVVAWVTEVWGGFVGWLTEVTNGFLSWWNEMWAGFGTWIGEVWQGFVTWIQGIWTGFVGWITGAILAYVGFWVGVWNNIVSFATGAWNRFVLGVQIIVGGLIAYWRAAFGGIVGFFAGIWANISGGVSSAWNGIIGFFQGIPGRVLSFFGGFGSLLSGAGRNLVDGLLSGIQNAWGRVTSWISNAASGVANTFKNVLGIRSPSRVFAGLGREIPRGIMVGLDSEQANLDARVASLVTPEPMSMWATPGAGTANGASTTSNGGGVVINGNVGWMPDRVASELAERQRQAAALAGLNTGAGMAA